MRTTGMGTPIARYCLALMAMLLLASGAFAQSTTDGAIGGTVTDPSGAAVPNAKVIVRNNGTNAEQIVSTDETGYFRVAKLTPASSRQMRPAIFASRNSRPPFTRLRSRPRASLISKPNRSSSMSDAFRSSPQSSALLPPARPCSFPRNCRRSIRPHQTLVLSWIKPPSRIFRSTAGAGRTSPS